MTIRAFLIIIETQYLAFFPSISVKVNNFALLGFNLGLEVVEKMGDILEWVVFGLVFWEVPYEKEG